MEFRHLRSFQAVVRYDGFHRAAEQTGYSQSSITAHIKMLEEELQTPLFDRLGRGIYLTEAGQQFLPYAQAISRLYEEGEQKVRHTTPYTGALTIGAAESLLNYWLPPTLEAFRTTYPEAALRMKGVSEQTVSDQLANNDIDLGMVVEETHWQPSASCQYIKIPHEMSLVRCHPSLRSSSDELLYTENDCSWRFLFETVRQEYAFPSIIRTELPSVVAIKQCVQSGLGWSLLPHLVMEEELASHQLEVLPTSLDRYPVAIYILWHHDKWFSPLMEAFVDLLPTTVE